MKSCRWDRPYHVPAGVSLGGHCSIFRSPHGEGKQDQERNSHSSLQPMRENTFVVCGSRGRMLWTGHPVSGRLGRALLGVSTPCRARPFVGSILRHFLVFLAGLLIGSHQGIG